MKKTKRFNHRNLGFILWLKRLPVLGVATVALVIALTVFILWAGFWRFVVGSGEGFDWGMLEAVSSAATLALAIGGGVVVLVELSDAVEAQNMTIYKDAFDLLTRDEQIEARRWIYQELPDDPYQTLTLLSQGTEKGRLAQKNIKMVLNALDYLGFLIQQDWVTRDEVIAWMSPIVVKIWARIGPYVEIEAEKRPKEPDYYEAVRYLAQLCIDYRAHAFGDIVDQDDFRSDAL